MVARIVALDSGPLGLVTNPNSAGEARLCSEWMLALLTDGVRILVPEVADFEIRRELLRAKKVLGLKHLDEMPDVAEYVPITTDAMRRAAELWSIARQQGRPTAPDARLDWDVVLAAQILTLDIIEPVVVATTNVAHISRYIKAAEWRDITSS